LADVGSEAHNIRAPCLRVHRLRRKQAMDGAPCLLICGDKWAAACIVRYSTGLTVGCNRAVFCSKQQQRALLLCMRLGIRDVVITWVTNAGRFHACKGEGSVLLLAAGASYSVRDAFWLSERRLMQHGGATHWSWEIVALPFILLALGIVTTCYIRPEQCRAFLHSCWRFFQALCGSRDFAELPAEPAYVEETTALLATAQVVQDHGTDHVIFPDGQEPTGERMTDPSTTHSADRTEESGGQRSGPRGPQREVTFMLFGMPDTCQTGTGVIAEGEVETESQVTYSSYLSAVSFFRRLLQHRGERNLPGAAEVALEYEHIQSIQARVESIRQRLGTYVSLTGADSILPSVVWWRHRYRYSRGAYPVPEEDASAFRQVVEYGRTGFHPDALRWAELPPSCRIIIANMLGIASAQPVLPRQTFWPLGTYVRPPSNVSTTSSESQLSEIERPE